MYWLVTSKFDMHDSSARCKKAKTEYCPNTKKILSSGPYNLQLNQGTEMRIPHRFTK